MSQRPPFAPAPLPLPAPEPEPPPPGPAPSPPPEPGLAVMAPASCAAPNSGSGGPCGAGAAGRGSTSGGGWATTRRGRAARGTGGNGLGAVAGGADFGPGGGDDASGSGSGAGSGAGASGGGGGGGSIRLTTMAGVSSMRLTGGSGLAHISAIKTAPCATSTGAAAALQRAGRGRSGRVLNRLTVMECEACVAWASATNACKNSRRLLKTSPRVRNVARTKIQPIDETDRRSVIRAVSRPAAFWRTNVSTPPMVPLNWNIHAESRCLLQLS